MLFPMSLGSRGNSLLFLTIFIFIAALIGVGTNKRFLIGVNQVLAEQERREIELLKQYVTLGSACPMLNPSWSVGQSISLPRADGSMNPPVIESNLSTRINTYCVRAVIESISPPTATIGIQYAKYNSTCGDWRPLFSRNCP